MVQLCELALFLDGFFAVERYEGDQGGIFRSSDVPYGGWGWLSRAAGSEAWGLRALRGVLRERWSTLEVVVLQCGRALVAHQCGTGSANEKLEPCPHSDSAHITPPWARTSPSHTLRPRPVPVTSSWAVLLAR